MTKSITIEYFASIAEQTSIPREQYQTSSATLQQLWEEISQRYALQCDRHTLRPASNHRFCTWQQPLKHGDTVAFIPPVSGG